MLRSRKYIKFLFLINIYMDNEGKNIVWFAMCAPYCKELEAKQLLDSQAIETFVPMCYKVFVKNGKKKKELVPAVRNLLFVRTSWEVIREVKKRILFLQYMTRPEAGKNIPIIVPDMQMQQFISVSRNYNEHLIYLTPEEINLSKGTRVRILGGPFDGVEGSFLKIKGCRSKRVVIQVQGIVAVAVAEVCPDLIEVIN